MYKKADSIRKYLPYSDFLTKDDISGASKEVVEKFAHKILALKDGSVMVVYRVELAINNLNKQHSKERRDKIFEWLTSVPDRFEMTYDVVKKAVPSSYVDMSGNMRSGAAKEIEELRHTYFSSSDEWESEIYLTFLMRSIQGVGITIDDLEQFFHRTESLETAFSSAGCRVTMLDKRATLNYLGFVLTGSTKEFIEPESDEDIDKVLTRCDYTLNTSPLFTKGLSQDRAIGAISLIALPNYTYPDAFAPLYSINSTMRVTIKVKFFSKKTAEKRIEKRKKQYKANLLSLTQSVKKELGAGDGEDWQTTQVYGKEECQEALELLASSDTSGCLVQFFVYSFENDEESLKKAQRTVQTTLEEDGFVPRREEMGLSLSFVSGLPGSSDDFRSFFITSENLADTLHIGRYYQGAKHSSLTQKRLGCDVPLLYLKNVDSSDYYLSLSGEDGEKGHTFITGQTGSGKSVFLSLLANAYLKYPHSRVVILDYDMSSLNTVLGNDGRVYVPGVDKTCFQPLKNCHERQEEIIEFIKAIAFANSAPFGSNERKLVSTSLDLLPKSFETMSMFRQVLKGQDASSQLIPAIDLYCSGGPYGEIFDSDCDGLETLSRITLIETSKILRGGGKGDEALRLPALIYLLNRLDAHFEDCVPTLLIMDEGWKYLKDEVFSSYIENWIKTLRKKNVDVVFSITNLSDIRGSSISETLLSNVETRIFMADSTANESLEKENYRALGLTDEEITIISHSPKFFPLIKQKGGLSLVNLVCGGQIEYLVTPQEMKKQYLCQN